MDFSFLTLIELFATVFGFTYLILLIKENKWCWYFGIISSLLSIYLFYVGKLYSEAILYVYYVIIGFYGLWLWSKPNSNTNLKINNISLKNTLLYVLLGLVLTVIVGYVFNNYTDAESPYLDASTSMFSFVASYLQAKKILNSWYFWIVINSVTLYLYYTKGYNLYFGLTIIYTVFSFTGLVKWKKSLA